MIDLLILLLRPALRYVEDEETPWWRLDLFCVAVVAWLLDMAIAHTTWRKLIGGLRPGEWTISHTLERLVKPENSSHPDYLLFVGVANRINRESPSGEHIKNAYLLSLKG